MGMADWCCGWMALSCNPTFGEDGKATWPSSLLGADSWMPILAFLDGLSLEEGMDDPDDFQRALLAGQQKMPWQP